MFIRLKSVQNILCCHFSILVIFASCQKCCAWSSQIIQMSENRHIYYKCFRMFEWYWLGIMKLSRLQESEVFTALWNHNCLNVWLLNAFPSSEICSLFSKYTFDCASCLDVNLRKCIEVYILSRPHDRELKYQYQLSPKPKINLKKVKKSVFLLHVLVNHKAHMSILSEWLLKK